MIRSLAALSAILVALLLGVALLGDRSANLVLTPAPMIDVVGLVPTAPVTSTNRIGSDQATGKADVA